jgi:hypothetical protein
VKKSLADQIRQNSERVVSIALEVALKAEQQMEDAIDRMKKELPGIRKKTELLKKFADALAKERRDRERSRKN